MEPWHGVLGSVVTPVCLWGREEWLEFLWILAQLEKCAIK